jgi:hypothetical protein
VFIISALALPVLGLAGLVPCMSRLSEVEKELAVARVETARAQAGIGESMSRAFALDSVGRHDLAFMVSFAGSFDAGYWTARAATLESSARKWSLWRNVAIGTMVLGVVSGFFGLVARPRAG